MQSKRLAARGKAPPPLVYVSGDERLYPQIAATIAPLWIVTPPDAELGGLGPDAGWVANAPSDEQREIRARARWSVIGRCVASVCVIDPQHAVALAQWTSTVYDLAAAALSGRPALAVIVDIAPVNGTGDAHACCDRIQPLRAAAQSALTQLIVRWPGVVGAVLPREQVLPAVARFVAELQAHNSQGGHHAG